MIVLSNEFPKLTNHLEYQLHVILLQKNEKFPLAAKLSDIYLCLYCLKNWICTL